MFLPNNMGIVYFKVSRFQGIKVRMKVAGYLLVWLFTSLHDVWLVSGVGFFFTFETWCYEWHIWLHMQDRLDGWLDKWMSEWVNEWMNEWHFCFINALSYCMSNNDQMDNWFNRNTHIWMERKGSILFDDALNTFYLLLYGVRHMVKDHSDSERVTLTDIIYSNYMQHHLVQKYSIFNNRLSGYL